MTRAATGGSAIRVASAAQVDWLLELAADEGWNPGLEDAAAFRAADPEGLLVALDRGDPVAGVSVVRQDDAHGFLGLYLCRPDARGQGHGWRVWQAGLAHLGERSVGLDGVVEQQGNYRRSGFAPAWRNVRFAGVPAHGGGGEGGIEASSGVGVREALAADLPALTAFDREIGGVDRRRFLNVWLVTTRTRRTLMVERQGRLRGFGTVRACRRHVKVGPLLADSPEVAGTLLERLARSVDDTEIVLDAPECNPAAIALARDAGLVPVFETARMYRGEAPPVDAERLFGVATLELG